MATAHDTITAALRMIGALAAGETADADTANDALLRLNRMLAGWELLGIRMSIATLALADTINLPDGQLEAIEANLAVKLAPEWGKEISPALALAAREGRKGLSAAYMVVPTLRADAAYTQRMPGDWS
jgi:hypothetical protein